MTIIAFDPSLTRTGWAVVTDGHVDVADAFRPTGDAPSAKAQSLAFSSAQIITAHRPSVALVEVPDRSVHARHRGGGAGLALYGFGAGTLYGMLLGEEIAVVPIPVAASEWTHGRTKAERRFLASALYAPYHSMPDAGGDIADAICLGAWYFRED